MKLRNQFKIILLSIIVFMFFFQKKSYSQQSILINTGTNYAQENMYLDKGLNLEMGYSLDFAENLFWQTAISIYKLKQNSTYSFSDEPTINSDILFLINNSEEIRLTNINVNTNVGITFFKNFIIHPVLLTGISSNYLIHRYSEPSVNHDNTHISVNSIDNNQFSVGFRVLGGLSANIFKNLSVQSFAGYSILPFAEIGIQKKSVNVFSWSVGIKYRI